MTKDELRDKFNESIRKAFENIHPLPYDDTYGDRVCYAMMYLTGKALTKSSYRCNLNLEKTFTLAQNTDREIVSQLKKDFEAKIKKGTSDVDMPKTYLQTIEYLDAHDILYLLHRNFYEHYIIMEDMLIIYNNNDERSSFEFLSETGETPEWFEGCIVYQDDSERDTYKYVVRGQYGFTTRELDINDIKVDINMNYNDDIPDNEIRKFLMSDEAGVMIFHGEPGTGKTTFIRHLVSKFGKKKFLYLDASCFNYITDASFLQLLMNYSNSVLILEDSEKLLKSRENSQANMSTLLNMTDGILADSLKLKMICTFNAPIENIDKALLRKGRLKVKYNFSKLKKDKVAKLFNKLGLGEEKCEDMTLADIYNFKEEVEFGQKKKSSVGF